MPSILNDCLGELENGDMTVAQLVDELGHDRENVRKATTRAANEPRPRALHIVGWVMTQPGERAYPRPIYRLGDGSNKKRPAPKDRATIVREWSQRKHALLKASSVFNLGIAQRDARKVKARPVQEPAG